MAKFPEYRPHRLGVRVSNRLNVLSFRHCCRQAVQSACDDRCRNGKIFEQDAGGAIPVVHVLAGRRVGLSARHLRYGTERTQGAHADALKQDAEPRRWRMAMKSDDLLPRIDRRTLVSGLALLPAAGSLLSTPVRAQNASSAPQASWTDGPAKQTIIDFVRATTDQSSPKFVAAEDRIVCFD